MSLGLGMRRRGCMLEGRRGGFGYDLKLNRVWTVLFKVCQRPSRSAWPFGLIGQSHGPGLSLGRIFDSGV